MRGSIVEFLQTIKLKRKDEQLMGVLNVCGVGVFIVDTTNLEVTESEHLLFKNSIASEIFN